MRGVVAKRLRKEADYHPKMPRDYVGLKMGDINPGITCWLDSSDPRAIYKDLKKEYKNAMGIL